MARRTSPWLRGGLLACAIGCGSSVTNVGALGDVQGTSDGGPGSSAQDGAVPADSATSTSPDAAIDVDHDAGTDPHACAAGSCGTHVCGVDECGHSCGVCGGTEPACVAGACTHTCPGATCVDHDGQHVCEGERGTHGCTGGTLNVQICTCIAGAWTSCGACL